MDRLKVLLRRVIDRARVSPNPVVRWTIRRSRDAFRWLGWLLPGLHLGWMAMLRDARWDRDDLVLRGWSYVRGTDHGGSPHHEVYLSRHRLPVWLGGRLARATVRHVLDLDVTWAGHGEIYYSARRGRPASLPPTSLLSRPANGGCGRSRAVAHGDPGAGSRTSTGTGHPSSSDARSCPDGSSDLRPICDAGC
jgi:hypothetical protein